MAKGKPNTPRKGMSYRARRFWALVLLLVGMPLYIALAVTVMNLMGRPHILVELAVYIVLGVAWILPFKFVFRGVGKEDPDAIGDDHPR